MLFGSGSVTVTWVGTIGFGLSIASIFPTTVNLAERRMTITGKITAWFFVGASLGGMTLPLIIGQLYDLIGPRITPAVLLSSMVLAAFVFIYLLKVFNGSPGDS